jgi:hypothetical protein
MRVTTPSNSQLRQPSAIRSALKPSISLTRLHAGVVNHPALCRVSDAYGGLSLWRKLKGVVLQIDSLGGPLLVAKGLGRTFLPPTIVTVDPLHWRVEFHDFPHAGEKAIFSRGRVQFLNRAGAFALDRPRYRESFSRIKKYRRWSQSDAVYFFGYALSTYLSIPFLLSEHATYVQEWKHGIRVAARFPQDLDTHSSDQVFWMIVKVFSCDMTIAQRLWDGGPRARTLLPNIVESPACRSRHTVKCMPDCFGP